MLCVICGCESQYPDMCEKCHTAAWIRRTDKECERVSRVISGVFDKMKEEGYIVK